MGHKDIKQKLLEDHNDVFADIVNTLLLKKEYIDPGRLKEGPTESIYKDAFDDDKVQMRDVIKRYEDNNILICSIGIENQAKIDKTMPVRVMNYDAATYKYQVKSGSRKIAPVITVVLNFSERRWGRAKSLFDILSLPEEIAPFVSDYKINVIDVAFLKDEEIAGLKSDFKVVADFFKQKRTGEKYKPSRDEIRYVTETLKLLSIFAGDKRYEEIIPDMLKKEGGVNMCSIVDQFEQSGFERGERHGFELGEKHGFERGEKRGEKRVKNKMLFAYFRSGESAEKAAEVFELPLDEVLEIRKEWEKEESGC